MNKITVKKDELIEILVKNRSEHRAIFLEAVEGYKRRVIEELQSRLDAAIAGTKWDATIFLQQPEDHTSDYDRAIRMLKMDVDDTVVVTQQEFTMYVEDEWGWKDRFLTSNSTYSARAEMATANRNQNQW